MTLRNVMVCALGLAVVIGLGGRYSTAYAQGQQNAGKFTIERNKAAVRRWIDEGFNKKNVKAVDDLFAADFAVNGQKVGREGLKQSMSRFLSAFPDLHVTIDEIVAERNKVGIWYTVQGTHHGEFEGIPPTGRMVSWYGFDLLRVEGGKIADARFVADLLGLLQQLGARISPAPTQK